MATIRPTLRLGERDEGRPVSAGDFAGADFDEPYRYERQGGRLIVVAPSGEGHVDATEPWRDRLVFYKRDHPEVVQKVVSEAWVRVDGGTDRVGDIGVYLAPRGPVPPIPERVPELIFEVVSPERASRRRDYELKRREYHRLGVREYVIIDRFRRAVAVLAHAPDGYEERLLSVDDAYESPLLPGLSIRIADVF